MFYKFSYSSIDSKFGFGHGTAISKDNNGNIIYESIIHIPDPKEFEKKTSYNPIQSFHRQIRKITKTKPVYNSELGLRLSQILLKNGNNQSIIGH